MINIENIVFEAVAKAVDSAHEGVTCGAGYMDTPSAFPYVALVEDDNYTVQNTQDENLQEHYAHLFYSVNIFTNNTNGKETLAKQIADTVDTAMQNMKFTRIMRSQIPNVDRSLYRIVMRYEAIVQQGKEDGKNTVFQMYRT